GDSARYSAHCLRRDLALRSIKRWFQSFEALAVRDRRGDEMSKVFACARVLALCSQAAFSQQPDSAPKFDIADVHASAKSVIRFMRTGPVRAGRYDIKSA